MNVIIFGPPGAGKGTQSNNIINDFDLKQVSTGDLLRNEVKHQTDLGKKITPIINKGELVSDKVVNELQENPDINVAILVNPYFKKNSPSDIKVVLNKNNDVLYLSRSDIPSNSRTKCPSSLKAYHILPFRKEFLLEYTQWEKGTLEQIEFNEYLRILEHGHRIRAVHVESDVVSVDTEDDLEFVRKKMLSDPFLQKYMSTRLGDYRDSSNAK